MNSFTWHAFLPFFFTLGKQKSEITVAEHDFILERKKYDFE